MKMDRKVMYGLLIGGVALVGAAVAYHLSNKPNEDEAGLDDDLAELGPLETEESTGMIKFEYFLKIF